MRPIHEHISCSGWLSKVSSAPRNNDSYFNEAASVGQKSEKVSRDAVGPLASVELLLDDVHHESLDDRLHALVPTKETIINTS